MREYLVAKVLVLQRSYLVAVLVLQNKSNGFMGAVGSGHGRHKCWFDFVQVLVL